MKKSLFFKTITSSCIMAACACMFILFSSSCEGGSNSQEDNSTETTVNEATESTPSATTTTDATESAASEKGVTTMQFEEPAYNFGTVAEGEIVERIFAFTNSGNEPLLITNASTSCGCTVPEWPKDEIAPGERREIKVRFNTQGKTGTQSKKIWVTANTSPATTTVVLNGQVTPKESVQ